MKTIIQTKTEPSVAAQLPEHPAAFSARSQVSFHREKDLRINLKKIDLAIGKCKSDIQKLQSDKTRLTERAVIRGEEHSREPLRMAIDNLAREQSLLPELEEKRSFILAEIEALKLSPEEAEERLSKQQKLAQLATDRLNSDQEIQQLVQDLRQRLLRRDKATAEMKQCAESLEMTLIPDGLDVARFRQLLSALPDSICEESDRWLSWFLGKRTSAKPYVVIAEHFHTHETLNHSGIYYRGDRVWLTDEQAREPLRWDRTAQRDYGDPVELQDASIATVEDYERAKAPDGEHFVGYHLRTENRAAGISHKGGSGNVH